VPSRSEPPSAAARLAANAPNNIAAVSQKGKLSGAISCVVGGDFCFDDCVVYTLLGSQLNEFGTAFTRTNNMSSRGSKFGPPTQTGEFSDG
jgi:hypothetical protein